MTTFASFHSKKVSITLAFGLMLSACQSTQTTPTAANKPTAILQPSTTVEPTVTLQSEPKAPEAFSITGKIGVSTQTPEGKQAGSAFYAWRQEDERFGIELTGALGMGATHIQYDGAIATLNSDKTGVIEADSPETLLFKATGWHAPIGQLRYWIVGVPSPKDTQVQLDLEGRLISSTHDAWMATFSYQKSRYPHRLTILHNDGHRIVMTINHQAQP